MGGIDFHTTAGTPGEVVVITEVGGQPVVLLGTDGTPEAVAAVEKVAELMSKALGHPTPIVVDVGSATVRQVKAVENRRRSGSGENT